jgi:hypothetical protein
VRIGCCVYAYVGVWCGARYGEWCRGTLHEIRRSVVGIRLREPLQRLRHRQNSAGKKQINKEEVRKEELKRNRQTNLWLRLRMILRPTVSRPVRLGVGHRFRAYYSILLFFVLQLLTFFFMQMPSLTRGRVCSLQCNHTSVRVAQVL